MANNWIWLLTISPLYMAYEIPTKNRGKQGKKDKSLFKGNRRDCRHNKANKHMARKTFASTMLLYNDVPMEIVSELLGHSSIKVTQEYYGKVVQKSIRFFSATILKAMNEQHLISFWIKSDSTYSWTKLCLIFVLYMERTDIVYHPRRIKVSIAIFIANPFIA